MTITFMDGFEAYGPPMRSGFASAKFSAVGGKAQPGSKAKAEFALAHGANRSTIDITPPADGRWTVVSVAVKVEEDGTLYTMDQPQTYNLDEFHAISPIIDALSPEEFLEIASPRQLVRALRVAERRGDCPPVLLFDEDGNRRT